MFRRTQFQRSATEVAGGSTISLVKNEKGPVLAKDGSVLTHVTVGAGWDEAPAGSAARDLDLFAFCTGADGKALGINQCLFYNNKTLPGMKHGGDNLTGAGAGDDERCFIDLAAIPADVHGIIVGINFYNAGTRHFGEVKNAYVRYAPHTSPDDMSQTIKKYDLSEDYSAFTAVYGFRFYRHDGGWKYEALGLGGNGAIDVLLNNYNPA